MKSSYKNELDYSEIFSLLCFIVKPKKIVEFGILDGFSLQTIADNVVDCEIEAYDIFEQFNGNSANKKDLEIKFNNYSNIRINYGDFYIQHQHIKNNSLDILHVDIANNGNVYEYVFQNYIEKIKAGGYIILEGGSEERDNVEWMNKYNKPKIYPIIQKYKKQYDIITIGNLPSLTIIKI